MSKILSLTACLSMLAGTLSLSAQEPVTLAEWTFEKAYTAGETVDGKTVYTPTQENQTDISYQWFNANTPSILPETFTGNQNDYSLSAFSEGRYWQICTGYETKVFRIENTVENPTTDYSAADNHKAYYEVSFPTIGYKDINLTFAIAPGNNIETPVEIVVSTDGGSTWFDAGNVNTSTAWFLYTDAVTTLSVNNKENVIVRLLPTTGCTNWNLRNLKITAEPMDVLPSVSNKDVTFTWPLGELTPKGSATASNGEIFSIYELGIGSDLTITRVGTPTGGKAQTLFNPVSKNSATMNIAEALTLTVTPKKGISFRPTGIALQASKWGTGGGKLGFEVMQGDNTIVEAKDLGDIARNNDFTQLEEAINGAALSSEPVVINLYIYSLDGPNKKELGIGDIILKGVADGQVEPVPAYTLTLNSSMPEAGNISIAPAGTEFDEGTQLTVRSTENFGFHFTGWTDGQGKEISTANPYTFTIEGNTVLTANYIRNNVYPINLVIEGGANANQVLYQPAGNIVDGVHYYEEGTEVQLTTVDNRIITFNNWEDNTTAPVRMIKMDAAKDITATFSATDYIVGWDFYLDQPNSQRAADYKDESDNAGLLSLRKPDGTTTSWLTRGVGNGSENGRYGARIWKEQKEGYYYEVSFRSLGYSNLVLNVSLGGSYNTYNNFDVEYSIDGGETFNKIATYEVTKAWKDFVTPLPEDAGDKESVKIRFMPVATSGLNDGSATTLDGLCIADLYILADRDAANDDIAPVLISTIPANNAEGASATGSIILTFDEKVQAGTGNATLNGEILTAKESGKSIVCSYAGLAYGTTYTFTVPAGAITDRNGNAFEGTSITFTTLERQQPESRLFDAIVAADGSGDHTTLQAAIDAAPTQSVKPYLIFVKNGRYNEHINIPATKPYLHIIGQDRDEAVIYDDRLCGTGGYHVSEGSTVVVNANDCMFENITLENSYGHEKQDGPQALALNTGGDRTILNNVALLSYQDTWITPSTSSYRAYVRNSLIEGAVDFIYNSGDIYIENTTLLITRKSGGYIVAPSHDKDVKWGYVFNNCTITAPGVPSETSIWLGRPWHNYPKTVFLNTRAEVTIPAAGWYETMGGLPALWADWNTVDANGNPLDLSQRRDTYYRMENDEKVYGKAKNFLTDQEAAEYTVRNVLSGADQWEPVIKTEACETPEVTLDGNTLSWKEVPYAICYLITRGGEVIDFVKETSYTLTPARDADENEPYKVQAVNEFGGLSAKGIAGDKSGIDTVDASAEIIAIEYFDLSGIRLTEPVKGVNIVRTVYADGHVSVDKHVMR